MQGRSLRRLLAVLSSLLVLVVVIAGIIFTQGDPSANGTATPPASVATTTVVVAARGVTVTPVPTVSSRQAQPTPTTAAASGGRQNPTVTPTPRQRGTAPVADDGLPTIAFGSLPPEAQRTIDLIDRGGPFPYDRDGIVFGNRERLLPGQPNGYYHEYTVITPGSSDRGARRIIAGQGGQLYYTDDHYQSFRRVLR